MIGLRNGPCTAVARHRRWTCENWLLISRFLTVPTFYIRMVFEEFFCFILFGRPFKLLWLCRSLCCFGLVYEESGTIFVLFLSDFFSWFLDETLCFWEMLHFIFLFLMMGFWNCTCSGQPCERQRTRPVIRRKLTCDIWLVSLSLANVPLVLIWFLPRSLQYFFLFCSEVLVCLLLSKFLKRCG